MRPKAFTADIEALWRKDYAETYPEVREAIGEEQYFARRWLTQYCHLVGMCVPHSSAFAVVHDALCGQGGNCWDVTTGLISLILKATAHRRG